MIRPLLLCIFLFCRPALAIDKNTALHEGAETIRYMWKEWMKKGELRYDSLTESTLSKIQGNWIATYTGGDGEVVVLDFVIHSDGTWSSKAFRPDMKRGHWYLTEGMVLLVEGKVEDEASDLATAIILRKNEFYVLNADAPKGLIPMAKGASTSHRSR